METLAMQARKQPSGYTGLVVQGKYISICGSIFFWSGSVSNHKKWCLKLMLRDCLSLGLMLTQFY